MLFARFTKEIVLNQGNAKVEAGTTAVLSFNTKDKSNPPTATFTFMPGRVIGNADNRPSFMAAGEVYKLKDEGVEIMDDEGCKYEMILEPTTGVVNFYKLRHTIVNQAGAQPSTSDQQPTEGQQPTETQPRATEQASTPDQNQAQIPAQTQPTKDEINEMVRNILDEAATKLREIGVDFTLGRPGDTEPENFAEVLKSMNEEEDDEIPPHGSYMSDDLEELVIDNEAKRTYSFFAMIPGTSELTPINYEIIMPIVLYTREGGSTHRVQDIDGIVHNVPAPGYAGCTVTWEPKPGELAVTA
jgi:hypothetical protein